MKARDRIISALKLASERGITNYELGAITKTGSMKLYPVLYDLEGAGRVRSEFDEGTKKPRRRRYWWIDNISGV